MSDYADSGTGETLLTVSEAATQLNRSRFTIYRMIQNGTMPAVRVHGRHSLLIDEAVLQDVFAPVAIRNVQAVMTPTEVAGLLRCSVETVRRMVNSGVLKATRNPGRNSHMRIDTDSVHAYLDQQQQPAAVAS